MDRSIAGRGFGDVAGNRWVRRLWLPVVLAAYGVALSPTLGQPLLESHGFRQTQTAYTALWFHEHGVDLLRPVVPVFGRASPVVLELPLFQAAAATVMSFGVAPDLAMRLTGLATFLVLAALVHTFVAKVASKPAAVAALVVFLVSPFSIVWARTSMIEHLAAAGGVGWLFGFLHVAERDGRRWPVAVAVASGTMGALVKPTTASAYLAAGVLLVISRWGLRSWRAIVPLAVLVVPPLAAAAVWTRWADAVKSTNEMTAPLVSGRMVTWNFGTLAQRRRPLLWWTIFDRVELLALGGAIGTAALIWALCLGRDRRTSWCLAVGAFAPMVVFFNLYARHDYYLAAAMPLLAAIAGIGLASVARALGSTVLAQRVRSPTVRLVGLLGLWSAVAGATAGFYPAALYGSHGQQTLALAAEVRAATAPSDLVTTTGLDWSPEVLYYARREGVMLLPAVTPQQRRAAAAEAAVLVSLDPRIDDLALLGDAGWFAPRSPHVFALRVVPGDEPVAATMTAAPVPGPVASAVHVVCGAPPVAVDAARGVTMARLGDVPSSARLRLDVSPTLLPAPRTLVLAPRPAPVQVSCSGAASLDLEVHAPPEAGAAVA